MKAWHRASSEEPGEQEPAAPSAWPARDVCSAGGPSERPLGEMRAVRVGAHWAWP